MCAGFTVLVSPSGVGVFFTRCARGGLAEGAGVPVTGLVGARAGACVRFLGGSGRGCGGEDQSPGQEGGRGECR